MKTSLKHVVLCAGISMLALQLQAQTAPENDQETKSEMFREVPNPEKMAQKETDRLKEALNLTDKQYKKVYKLILKEQRELLENGMQRPPMMDGGGGKGPRPSHDGGMPPMGGGRPEGMRRPMDGGSSKSENSEEMQKRIAKKNKKMKKILTEAQYDQWLSMSQKPMPRHKSEGTPKQEEMISED